MNFRGLILSTFRLSKTSKQAKSNSFSNGKKQLSSGLLEKSGPGKAPSEQTFFKPSPEISMFRKDVPWNSLASAWCQFLGDTTWRRRESKMAEKGTDSLRA